METRLKVYDRDELASSHPSANLPALMLSELVFHSAFVHRDEVLADPEWLTALSFRYQQEWRNEAWLFVMM